MRLDLALNCLQGSSTSGPCVLGTLPCDEQVTENAPWFIIESNDKKYARIKTLKIVIDALEKACEAQLS